MTHLEKHEILDFSIMLLFIASGLLLFILFLYLPTYNKLGWHYPFGWDTPAYLSQARVILEDGYLTLLSYSKYPFGTSLLIAFVSIIFENDLVKTGIIFPILCLALYQFSSVLLYYKAYKSPFFAGLLALIIPFFYSTFKLISHLYQQLLYTAILPFIFYFIAHYIESKGLRDLLPLIIVIVIEWLVWPWGTYLTSLILLSALLLGKVKTYKHSIKIKVTIKMSTFLCALLGVILLLAQIYWQLFIFNSRFEGIIELSKTRPQYTFDYFFAITSNHNLVLFSSFCVGLTYSFIYFFNNRYRRSNSKEFTIQDLVTIFNIAVMIFILFCPQDIREIQNRLTLTIFSQWFIVRAVNVVSSEISKLISRKTQIRIYNRIFPPEEIKAAISILLLALISSQLCLMISKPPFEWRRWLPINDAIFVKALSSAKTELGNVIKHNNYFVVILSDKNPDKEFNEAHIMLIRLYVESFFPHSSILYNIKPQGDESLLVNTITRNVDYSSYENVLILILPELFKEIDNLPRSCTDQIKDKGYCLIYVK